MPSKAKQSTTATKDAPAKTASAKDAPAKKVNPALMKPLQPSKELAAVVGSKPLPRAEVVSKVWDYIKTHKLQDPQNKRKRREGERICELRMAPVCRALSLAGLWRFGGVLGGVGHKLRLTLLKRPRFFGGSCSRPPSRKIIPP